MRVLELIIDGVERMQADALVDSHQRAFGVLQHTGFPTSSQRAELPTTYP